MASDVEAPDMAGDEGREEGRGGGSQPGPASPGVVSLFSVSKVWVQGGEGGQNWEGGAPPPQGGCVGGGGHPHFSLKSVAKGRKAGGTSQFDS